MKRLRNVKWESVLIGFTVCVFCVMLGWFLRGLRMHGVFFVETEHTVKQAAPVASAQDSPVKQPEEVTALPLAVTDSPEQSPDVSETAAEATDNPEERTGKINLNEANAELLEELPGIGEVLARRILDYREANGSFSAVEELLDIDGIGEKTYEKIRDFVEVR